MRKQLLAVTAAVLALASAPAVATAQSGSPGALQASVQSAVTEQLAASLAQTGQTAVNANAPVVIAAGDVSSGSSSASQDADSTAHADAGNWAETGQSSTQNQTVDGADGCKAGCGGAGAAQVSLQAAATEQLAAAKALSDQTAVNGNAPVTIAAGDVTSGSSSASQDADSTAGAEAGNAAKTNQSSTQNQAVGGPSGCYAGCGGPGAAQENVQHAGTAQLAAAAAGSDQTAVNGNAPVTIAAGNVQSGPSSASQDADSKAKAHADNGARTDQSSTQNQTVGGTSACHAGCGGAGAAQVNVQKALTEQLAGAKALSGQTAVNGNAPVIIAAGDVSTGSSAASQEADSKANAGAGNWANTGQSSTQNQTVGGAGGCKAGCGGAGGLQINVQLAATAQAAGAKALSEQTAVNGNAPVTVAGGHVTSGSSSASQDADSKAKADAHNGAKTDQSSRQNQAVGGAGPCKAGCGGAGAAQVNLQKTLTAQLAAAHAASGQKAVNANAPVTIAGGHVRSGPSSATQHARSQGKSFGGNAAKTGQTSALNQVIH